MYHAAPCIERAAIQNDGLIPNRPDGTKFPSGVYLFTSLANAVRYAEGRREWERDEYGEEASAYEVWEVDTAGLSLFPDPEDATQDNYPEPIESFYSEQAIKPSSLRLLTDGERHALMSETSPKRRKQK